LNIKKVSYSGENEEKAIRFIENVVEKILLERMSISEQEKMNLIVSKYKEH
jgi:hypothetical protein